MLRAFCCIVLCIIISPPCLYANSPVSNVGGTRVDAGITNVEMRVGAADSNVETLGSNQVRIRQHIDYGFNDWYAFRVQVVQSQRSNQNIEHQSVTIENRFQLFESRIHGWDGGFRLNYIRNDSDKAPDEFEFRLLADVALDPDWNFRQNIFFRHDIGSKSENGISIQFRQRLSRIMKTKIPLANSWELGFDLFNNIGNIKAISGFDSQNHQMGPVITFNFDDDITIRTIYRRGLSGNSIDHNVGLFLSKEF